MSGREPFESWTAFPPRLGELVAVCDDGMTAMVVDPACPGSPAQRARSVVDLRACDIGAEVVLICPGADPDRPIVMGVVRGSAGHRETVCVESDGERMVVSAEHQLVLRCGKASITLTKAGKVLIQGTYVCSKSTGLQRIQGSAVTLN
jgi:hypothetical protein